MHITGCIQTHEEEMLKHNYFLATIRLFDNINKDLNNHEMKFSSRHDKNGLIRLIENEYVFIKAGHVF